MRVMKRCIVCGNEFIADRRTAKYCSKICHTKSKSLRPREDAIEQMIIKQKEKSTQPETMACCRHPDCFYHGTKNTTPTCDYLLHTGTPRGCKISECDKYRPEGKKNKSIVIFDRLTKEEKAIISAQYDALNLRLDQYEIQKRHSKERK